MLNNTKKESAYNEKLGISSIYLGKNLMFRYV